MRKIVTQRALWWTDRLLQLLSIIEAMLTITQAWQENHELRKMRGCKPSVRVLELTPRIGVRVMVIETSKNCRSRNLHRKEEVFTPMHSRNQIVLKRVSAWIIPQRIQTRRTTISSVLRAILRAITSKHRLKLLPSVMYSTNNTETIMYKLLRKYKI